MIAPVVLALLLAHMPAGVVVAPQGALQQASTAPDPAKPEQPWPPAGVSRPGGGVTAPRLILDSRPNYTSDAMKAKIQGAIVMEAVVQTDGRVGEVRVVRSLDKAHGLDDEAVKTVKRWRFEPGKKEGVGVPVLVEIEMTFSLRK
jgi:protein TonB